MKYAIKFFCTILLIAVLAALGPAAVYAASPNADCTMVLPCTEVPIYDNDTFIGCGYLIGDTTVVPLRTFTEAILDTPCDTQWDPESGTALLTAENLCISLKPEDGYMVANGRYLYLQNSVYNINGTIVVPIRELARVFGIPVVWNEADCSISIDTSVLSVLEGGDDYYPEEDLFWLSRVIYSESGNQPLEGMIGVGNVVLNRAADDSGLFGDGILGVIFLPGQFDVVAAGTIYLQPSEKAVAAAKLCLEGYNTVGDCKWFVNPAIGSTKWFKTYKTFALTIEDHDFYA